MTAPTVVLTRAHTDRMTQELAQRLPYRVCGAAVTRTEVDHARLAECRTSAAWLALTSPRTVRILEAHGIFPDVRQVAVVGSGTARATRAAGIEPTVVAEGSARALAAQLLTYSPASIVVPGSASSSPLLRDTLTEAGWCVHTIPLYDTVPLSQMPDIYAEASVIAATAGSAVRALASWGLWPQGPALVTIGEPSAAVAQTLGIEVAGVATAPSAAGFADTLSTLLRQPSQLKEGSSYAS